MKRLKNSPWYKVDENGNIYGVEGRILTPRPTKTGYMRVHLKVAKGVYKDQYIHRLVAETYIPNPNNFPCVNHIDGDKTNNSVQNLEWCTYAMNMRHASICGLININSPKRKTQCKINQAKSVVVNSRPMAEYDEQGRLVRIHSSGSNALYRLSYRNHFYRDVGLMEQLHTVLPTKIDVTRINMVRNKNRHYYLCSSSNGEIVLFCKLSELPITREQLYYAYNHNTVDAQGNTWDILNA